MASEELFTHEVINFPIIIHFWSAITVVHRRITCKIKKKKNKTYFARHFFFCSHSKYVWICNLRENGLPYLIRELTLFGRESNACIVNFGGVNQINIEEALDRQTEFYATN